MTYILKYGQLNKCPKSSVIKSAVLLILYVCKCFYLFPIITHWLMLHHAQAELISKYSMLQFKSKCALLLSCSRAQW